MREINNLVDGWLAKNKKISHFQQNDFLRKLTLFWPKIVGEKYSIYSTPSRIIKESKNRTDFLDNLSEICAAISSNCFLIILCCW